MKLPKVLNIGSRAYKVIEVDKLLDDSNAVGRINYHTMVIEIHDKKGCYSDHFLMETIAHEFAHGYFNQHHSDLNTEKNCDIFADMFMLLTKNLKSTKR